MHSTPGPARAARTFRRIHTSAGSARHALDELGLLERASLVGLLTLTLGLIVVPWLLPHGPLDIVGRPIEPPSSRALLGTDEQGRDMLTRTIYGMRTTWFAVFPVIGSGILVGGLIGAVAGLIGGWVDNALMRFTDVVLALPGTLLTIALAASLGRGLWPTLAAISVTFWPPYARIMRGEVKRIAVRPHVEAARMGGVGRGRLVLFHVVPGLTGPMLVQATLDVAVVVLILAGLSFLGLGQVPPAPELGAMTSRGLQFMFSAWWIPVIPAAGVFMLALVANLAGDAVADLSDA